MASRDALLETLSLFNLHDTPLDDVAQHIQGYLIVATITQKIKNVSLKIGKHVPTREEGRLIMHAAALLYTFNDAKIIKRYPGMTVVGLYV